MRLRQSKVMKSATKNTLSMTILFPDEMKFKLKTKEF
jgi:hypothetical protein